MKTQQEQQQQQQQQQRQQQRQQWQQPVLTAEEEQIVKIVGHLADEVATRKIDTKPADTKFDLDSFNKQEFMDQCEALVKKLNDAATTTFDKFPWNDYSLELLFDAACKFVDKFKVFEENGLSRKLENCRLRNEAIVIYLMRIITKLQYRTNLMIEGRGVVYMIAARALVTNYRTYSEVNVVDEAQFLVKNSTVLNKTELEPHQVSAITAIAKDIIGNWSGQLQRDLYENRNLIFDIYAIKKLLLNTASINKFEIELKSNLKNAPRPEKLVKLPESADDKEVSVVEYLHRYFYQLHKLNWIHPSHIFCQLLPHEDLFKLCLKSMQRVYYLMRMEAASKDEVIKIREKIETVLIAVMCHSYTEADKKWLRTVFRNGLEDQKIFFYHFH